jgi:hypothetical protein
MFVTECKLCLTLFIIHFIDSVILFATALLSVKYKAAEYQEKKKKNIRHFSTGI